MNSKWNTSGRRVMRLSWIRLFSRIIRNSTVMCLSSGGRSRISSLTNLTLFLIRLTLPNGCMGCLFSSRTLSAPLTKSSLRLKSTEPSHWLANCRKRTTGTYKANYSSSGQNNSQQARNKSHHNNKYSVATFPSASWHTSPSYVFSKTF
jgi:hypothetical protein